MPPRRKSQILNALEEQKRDELEARIKQETKERIEL